MPRRGTSSTTSRLNESASVALKDLLQGLEALAVEADGEGVPHAHGLAILAAGGELGESLDDTDGLVVKVGGYRSHDLDLATLAKISVALGVNLITV